MKLTKKQHNEMLAFSYCCIGLGLIGIGIGLMFWSIKNFDLLLKWFG